LKASRAFDSIDYIGDDYIGDDCIGDDCIGGLESFQGL
jgi:hypothetical protein